MTSTSHPTHERPTVSWNPPARRLPRSEAFPSGTVIEGRYIARGTIGQGGMGTVLEVENIVDGKTYALKYCQGGINVQRRFIREVRILKHLRHRHVVPVLDTGHAGTIPFYVMPLARGSLQKEVESLASRLPEALKVFRQICEGVLAIHSAGVVHRDLKPSNILRLHDGTIVVADLGAAKLDPRHSSVLTGTCAIVGTLAYLAPEQLLPGGSRLADRRSDVYQLGKILYQLISGRNPAVVELDSVPTGLAHVIRRATAIAPTDRYLDVESLLAALDALEQAVNIPSPLDRRSRLAALARRLTDPGKRGRPNPEILNECLSLLSEPTASGDAPRAGLTWFDDLPINLLRVLARDRADRFVEILNDFGRAISAEVSWQDFRYADYVSARMKAIFNATRHVGLRTRSLRILLITAVTLNRYAAMSDFKDMLRSIESLSLALPVAEMLRDHMDEFREAAFGLEPEELHPAIRSVLDELSWIETVSF